MHVSSPWVTAGLPVPYGFSSRLHNESLPFWGPFVPMRNSVSVKDEAGLISNTRADAWDTLLSHLCWCHSCWTVICNSVGWARRLFFFHRDFLPTRVSQAIALTSSGTVWHLNVNALASSSVYLCNSEKEKPPGELMTVDVGKLSRHTQPLSVETRFFTHASSTLTDHDK